MQEPLNQFHGQLICKCFLLETSMIICVQWILMLPI